MGITIKTIGPFPVDRNVARVEIFCEGENPDEWRCAVHCQDGIYESEAAGAKLLDEPRFGTLCAEALYGDIKDDPILDASGKPTGFKVSDAFPMIKSICYSLVMRKMAEPHQPSP